MLTVSNLEYVLCVVHYFSPGMGAKYCDEYVCLSVCPLAASYNAKIAWPNFTKFLCMLSVAVARSSFDHVVICYVLPVLQMTS